MPVNKESFERDFYEYSLVVSDTPFSSHKWDVNSPEASRLQRSLSAKAKALLLVVLVLVTLVIVALCFCFLYKKETEEEFWPSYKSDSRLERYPVAAVSTDSAPCAPIGKDILERNGTAVDAAIAVLFCMGAHNPHSMGLGGGFLMLYYERSTQKTHYLDAREVAPGKSTADMFKGNASLAAEGPLSIAVPGELAGYSEAHRLYGRLEWSELVKPTIEMCRRGILVSPHLARGIAKNKEKLKLGVIGDIFLKNNRTEVYKAGERLEMLDLANTLEVIANQSMQALYGPSKLATKFLKDLQDAGSIITQSDMEDYTPHWREAVQVKLRKNATLYGVSPPGSGVLLAFMMAVLDGYPEMNKHVKEDKHEAALAYHRIVESLKYAYAYRSKMEDNQEEMEKLTAKLTSKEYTDEIRRLIDDTRTYNNVSHYGIEGDYVEDHGTAHLSLIAPNGDAVSVTSTINQYFGSKLVSPSTGIVLNDEMDDFSSPNVTNMFGLPPTPFNHIVPKRRPMSSMTPMIMTDADGNVTLVLGGNGGTSITSGVLQVAVRSFFFEEDIKQSVDAPRIHHQLLPDILHYEKEFPMTMVEELRKFGHKLEEWSMGMMSIIMGVHRGEDGHLYANSDYRKGGDVEGF